MNLIKYLYTGPRSGVSLRVGSEVIDVDFIPGATVELPPEHEYVKTLIALKRLTAAPTVLGKKGEKNGS